MSMLTYDIYNYESQCRESIHFIRAFLGDLGWQPERINRRINELTYLNNQPFFRNDRNRFSDREYYNRLFHLVYELWNEVERLDRRVRVNRELDEGIYSEMED